jgi:1-acyl-sn-glycerol-3-phosphate acyltransferase
MLKPQFGPVRTAAWYFFGWSLCFIWSRLYLRAKVCGRNNVPAKGSFIFASNHASYLDPILLGTSIHRSLNYMAREDLFEKGFLAWALPRVQSFPVRRGEGDLGAIRQALKLLKTGKPLVIFPEGTRTEDGKLQSGKPGIGFIVAKSGVPVVPAYVEGSFEVMPKGAKELKRHQIKVYIGEPMRFEATSDRAAYQRISDEIMSRIAGLKELCEASA